MKKLLLLIIGCTFALRVCAVTTPLDSLSDRQLLSTAKKYQHGIMCEPNPKKAARIYSVLAQRGNIKAMHRLGKMYLNGDGVQQDYKKAFRLINRAAKQGDVNARCDLALMYQRGLGVKMNLRAAYTLYKMAADSGSAQGCYGVGYLLYKGHGVKQDYKKAIEYLEKSEKKKHPGASFLLASYYANGYDGNPDFDKAEEEYSRASKNGNSWTVDVTKHNLLGKIKNRHSRKGMWKHVKEKKINEYGMRQVVNNLNPEELQGEYIGTVYTYDWSKKVIVDEEDIRLEVENYGDSIAMKYYIGDSLVTEYSPEFDGKRYFTKKDKAYQKHFSWLLTSTKFEKVNNAIFAEIRSYSRKTRSFRKPMLAVLNKTKSPEGNITNNSTFILETANYRSGDIHIGLCTTEDLNLKITVSSVSGQVTKDLGVHHAQEGKATLTVPAVLNKGIYVVSVSNRNERHSKVITVRGHE